jgi:diphosphomevalonate decarboxylase
MMNMETAWKAPSNIALIKYWGKHGIQLPNNPSLSITLREAFTTTRWMAGRKERTDSSNGIDLHYLFEGEHVPEFEKRISNLLQKLSEELPFLSEYSISAGSSNTFPHSAGIASSASSMAALALCLTELEQAHTGRSADRQGFLQRASYLARLGSGSASRSIYGGWVSWGKTASLPESSDEFATPLSKTVHPLFAHPGVAIMVVSSARKPVSSSAGHILMDQHPFSPARYQQAHQNLSLLLDAMEAGDFGQFADIVENEALTLHSLLMTSAPDGLLMKPASLQVIEEVRKFRKTTGTPVCFTLDAGPNVLLIYPHQYRTRVLPFIEERLVPLCENGKWLDDSMGEGPVKTHSSASLSQTQGSAEIHSSASLSQTQGSAEIHSSASLSQTQGSAEIHSSASLSQTQGSAEIHGSTSLSQTQGGVETHSSASLRAYPSKIMLFGEYGILKGSMALAIPYPAFNGSFKPETENLDQEDHDFMKESNQHLQALLLKLLDEKHNYNYLNLNTFQRDVLSDLWFDSDIPQGYGLGSSGALVAAIFDRYANSAYKNRPLTEIRSMLASIEKFFHGTSSGLDPLVSYTAKPIRIDPNGNVASPDSTPTWVSPSFGIFLVDTGRPSQTGSHVEWFLGQHQDWEFQRAVNEVFLPEISQATLSLLDGNYSQFEESFGSISSFQLQYLYPMIPENFTSYIEHGLSTGDFYLKLCGSGGGGFMLGVTRLHENTANYFRDHGFSVIWLAEH